MLGRDKISPNKDLLYSSIKNNVVLITGGGGSIGSELCRQIINLEPKKLIIMDLSEEKLYLISQEFINNDNIEVLLGNAVDMNYLDYIFSYYNVDVIFHAASYKHVPIVESNPLQGLKNNVFSTLAVCKAAYFNDIKKVILISTDKAVRPTNVMGASKRLAEIIMQTFAVSPAYFVDDGKESKTAFSMVRFGNVLDSSGSVVPLFRKQISIGGPITLTHKKINRFFMTIPEASELVIQASSLAKGGDVFLLDMGDPVYIFDLAEKMIRLSGLTVKSDQKLDGDIEIKVTGLRPGEKLYEELIINAESEKTIHPLIYRAKEEITKMEELSNKINYLEHYINSNNRNDSLKILSELVPEWKNNYIGYLNKK